MPQVTVTIAGKTYRMACGEGEERHLEGLAASFGMTLLMQAAARAVRSGPDQAMLDAVADALAACR